MLCAIGYCDKDEEQAVKLAGWIRELGPYPGHTLFVARDISSNVRPFVNVGFDEVTEIQISDDSWRHWPESCNNVFGHVSRHIEYVLGAVPFLWLEADVVPLRPGWLNSIAMEYEKCGKPFMGDFVSVHTPELDVPDHMSGIAVYPGSMTNNAGMAIISHEMAWDVAASYQIVPRMATSKLILHAWKHPPFENYDTIQKEIYAIKPECVLFHADKSGTLIDLLRNKNAGVVDGVGGNLRTGRCSTGSAGSPIEISTPVCDILIKSYPPDFERLGYCLRSICKFARNFRRINVVVPHGTEKDLPGSVLSFAKIIPVAEHGEGYLFQQAVKSNAHEFTDAEYILHIDSDTMLTRPIDPFTFMNNGKVWWLYTPYSEIVCPWQKITEKFMDEAVDYEFMRRLPLFIPRWLHEDLAKWCFKRHGVRLHDYIMSQPDRGFSEFNALGAYAYTRHKDRFNWVNTTAEPMPDTVAIQRWSGDAFDDNVKAKCEEILSSSSDGDSEHGRLGIKTLELVETASAQRNGEVPPPAQTSSNPNGAANTIQVTDDKLDEIADVLLVQRRNRMAHARAVAAANRAAGIQPRRRGKRKKRKALA